MVDLYYDTQRLPLMVVILQINEHAAHVHHYITSVLVPGISMVSAIALELVILLIPSWGSTWQRTFKETEKISNKLSVPI